MLSRVLGPGIFGESAAAPEIAGRCKPLIHCLRRDNPETVRRYVKSYIEAIQLMKSDREISIKVLAKYLRSIKDREILAKTYHGAIQDNKFSRKQYPSIPGLQMAWTCWRKKIRKRKAPGPKTLSMPVSSKNWIKAATLMGCTKLKKNKRMSSQLMRGS